MLKYMYITNDPNVARIAEASGADRIFIDLETLNKEERQKNLDTVKSRHSYDDITKIKSILKTSEVIVRVNPINTNSKDEIEETLARGASIVMLPMFKETYEVKEFLSILDRRAKNCLLLETAEAVANLDEILKIKGIDEIHIGLNDLHLAYGLTFMFELLQNNVVEKLCRRIAEAKIPYGFGGVARLGEGLVSAEKVLAEHYRLGSSQVILSRAFCDTGKVCACDIEKEFREEVIKLREYEKLLCGQNANFFQQEHLQFCAQVKKIVEDRVKEQT